MQIPTSFQTAGPFNLGGGEIVVIAVVFLVLFGGKKLPEDGQRPWRRHQELQAGRERTAGRTASSKARRTHQAGSIGFIVVAHYGHVSRCALPDCQQDRRSMVPRKKF